jgi:hypothetical protein
MMSKYLLTVTATALLASGAVLGDERTLEKRVKADADGVVEISNVGSRSSCPAHAVGRTSRAMPISP